MMPDRKMFWRVIRRLLGANRGRLFVILLALGAGAAVTSALLNLQVDAQRRLTAEFRAFGSNIVVAPLQNGSESESQVTLDGSISEKIPSVLNGRLVGVVPVLFLIANAQPDGTQRPIPVVVAGSTGGQIRVTGTERGSAAIANSNANAGCIVGARVIAQMHLTPDAKLTLKNGNNEQMCRVTFSPATGGPEDDQISLPLNRAQSLAGLPGRVSLIEITAPGKAREITDYIALLQRTLLGVSVRPIRQFTEGEARIYERISGILSATIGIVLVLTALCVMAAMTNVAMERRNDVGLMKAIGGATRRVLRLFLAEAALLGLASGLLGGAVGILLSMWLGKAGVGVAGPPALDVYPFKIVLTIVVAIAGAFPLRRLGRIRPASLVRSGP